MDGLIALPNLNPYWKHYRHSTALRRSQNNFKNLYGESEKIFLYAGLDDGWSYPMPNLLTGKGFIDILCADLEGKQQEDVVKINNVEENGNDKLTFTVYRSNLYSGMAKQYARTYNFSTYIMIMMVIKASNLSFTIQETSMETENKRCLRFLFISHLVIRPSLPSAMSLI